MLSIAARAPPRPMSLVATSLLGASGIGRVSLALASRSVSSLAAAAAAPAACAVRRVPSSPPLHDAPSAPAPAHARLGLPTQSRRWKTRSIRFRKFNNNQMYNVITPIPLTHPEEAVTTEEHDKQLADEAEQAQRKTARGVKDGAYTWFSWRARQNPMLKEKDVPYGPLRPNDVATKSTLTRNFQFHDFQELRVEMARLHAEDPEKWGPRIFADIYDIEYQTAEELLALGAPDPDEEPAPTLWTHNPEYMKRTGRRPTPDDIDDRFAGRIAQAKPISDDELQELHEKIHNPEPHRVQRVRLRRKVYEQNYKDPKLIAEVDPLVRDPRHRYVFIDMWDRKKANQNRGIIVREANGILREATEFERQRITHRYWADYRDATPFSLRKRIPWRH